MTDKALFCIARLICFVGLLATVPGLALLAIGDAIDSVRA